MVRSLADSSRRDILTPMITDASYLNLPPGAPLPDVNSLRPFVAFVIIRSDVTTDWQRDVSRWLVASGCLSMAAWGIACTTWDDSVDEANLVAHDWAKIPEEHFVMTSWHADESLEEATYFARHLAFHPTLTLDRALIVEIGSANRETETLAMWARA